MPSIGRPEASLGRGDRDHGIEKNAGPVQDIGELSVMGLRKVALKGGGLDAVDGQNRKEQRLLA